MGRFTEATSLSEGLVTQTISEGITFTAGALVPGILLRHVGQQGGSKVMLRAVEATVAEYDR